MNFPLNTKLDLHHILPRYKGGFDNLSNLTLLCEKCHIQISKL